LLTAVAMVCAVMPVRAQQGRPSEYDVKAAYLYNFGKFVQWPARGNGGGGDSFVVCILGQDPFGPVLDATMQGEKVEGKKVVASRIARPQEAKDCRIVFISASEGGRLKPVLTALDRMGVLTVSDIPQFSRRGGMIEFVLDSNRVRFEVDLQAVSDAGLSISSELLKVAAAVRRNVRAGS
jgi:hypothetical protein